MMKMSERLLRKGALLKVGDSIPKLIAQELKARLDLTLSGQNVWLYTERTRTEDRAPQGCDLSADSRAGMARGGCDVASALKHTDSDMFEVNLLKAKFGLDKGVHFRKQAL